MKCAWRNPRPSIQLPLRVSHSGTRDLVRRTVFSCGWVSLGSLGRCFGGSLRSYVPKTEPGIGQTDQTHDRDGNDLRRPEQDRESPGNTFRHTVDLSGYPKTSELIDAEVSRSLGKSDEDADRDHDHQRG